MSNYSEEKIQKIWEKGEIIANCNQDVLRKDKCGAWIERNEYGNSDSIYGWQVDHKKPISKGGTDDISNLRPFQWENNESKGDDYPKYKSAVTADGDENINKEKRWEIS